MYPFIITLDDLDLVNLLKRAQKDRIVPWEKVDPSFSSFITREFKPIRSDVKIMRDIRYNDRALVLAPNVNIEFTPKGSKSCRVLFRKLF